MLELSLNLKKCVRNFERSEKILTHFFEFKVDSNIRVASIVLYTTHISHRNVSTLISLGRSWWTVHMSITNARVS